MPAFFSSPRSRPFRAQCRHMQATLRLEALEDRSLLSGSSCMRHALLADLTRQAQPFVLAGSPYGPQADSPVGRVASNDAARFAGVGSVLVTVPGAGTSLGTGTLISPRHVLTAAHVLDLNGDGRPDVTPDNVTFNLNLDTGGPVDRPDIRIRAEALTIHPNFAGFRNGSLRDDLAILTLPENAVPTSVPYYALAADGLTAGLPITFVGYGRSGTGESGFSEPASAVVKRSGTNVVDAFLGQDDRGQPAANEVFVFDFDGPDARRNVLGGPSLGNRVESTLGPGDSGGPTFVVQGDPSLPSSYWLAGVNTFGASGLAPPPLFGSLAGGINLGSYLAWINKIVAQTTSVEVVAGPSRMAVPANVTNGVSSPAEIGMTMPGTPPAIFPASGDETAVSIALQARTNNRGSLAPVPASPGPPADRAGSSAIVTESSRASSSGLAPLSFGRLRSAAFSAEPLTEAAETGATSDKPDAAPLPPPSEPAPADGSKETPHRSPSPATSAAKDSAETRLPATGEQRAVLDACFASDEANGMASVAALALLRSLFWNAADRRTKDDRAARRQAELRPGSNRPCG